MNLNEGGNGMISSHMAISQPLTTSPTTSNSSANDSSISAPSSIDTRRSVRLSVKSSKTTSLPFSQSKIHRTIAGGVASSHSPKLNVPKRTIGSSDNRGTLDSSTTYLTNIFNDSSDSHRHNNDNAVLENLLPSDQSDDDKMSLDNNRITKKTASGLASRSEILSYFTTESDGYKCKLCKKVYQCSKRSDANLRKHLASTAHQIQNVLFTSQLNEKSKSDLPAIAPDRRRELHNAAINCIVRDGLPFGVFRQPGMAEFLQTAIPGYRGPHRKTVRRKIGCLYSTYTKKLRAFFSKINFLALTTDMWRSAKRIHFISLTAHILTNTYESVPIVIGCRRIIGRHLSSNIERYITFELQRLNIKREQIISITTDNGSDVKKATSTFKYGNRVSCMAHNLNLVIKNGLCLWKEPNKKHFPLDITVDVNDWEDDDDDDEDDSAFDIDENLIETAIELLSEEEEKDDDDDDDDNDTNQNNNLSIKETSTDEYESDSDDNINFSLLNINDDILSGIDHYELLTSIFYLMKKTRAGIKFIINHNVTNEYVIKHFKLKNLDKTNQNKYGGLVLDMIIRWNSTFLLLDRLLLHKDIIKSVFSFPNDFDGLTGEQRKKLHELTLKQNEWDLLVSLRHVLEPFDVATTILSAQHYPTIGFAFYIWRLLSQFLETKRSDKPVEMALKESLRFRFNIQCVSKLPSGQLEMMKIAAYLDPIVYKLLDDNDRKSIRKLIFNQLKNTTARNIIPSSSSTQTTMNISNPLHKLAMLCGHDVLDTASSRNTGPLAIDEELINYTRAAATATSFQQFWTTHDKTLPRLAYLVKRTHVTPATSVSSESLFSIANFLNRKQRSSFSSRTLRYLLVLKNHHLLEEIEKKI